MSISSYLKRCFDPDQPRDENGRWVAVGFSSREFGVERVVDTKVQGGTKTVSRGRHPETFTDRVQAEVFADLLNRGVENPQKLPDLPENRKPKLPKTRTNSPTQQRGFLGAVTRLLGRKEEIFYSSATGNSILLYRDE